MPNEQHIERLIGSVRILTGRWLSAEEAQHLLRRSGNREELVAKGVLEEGWLAQHLAGLALFDEAGRASAIPTAPLGKAEEPKVTGPPREALIALVSGLLEEPSALAVTAALERLVRSEDAGPPALKHVTE